jgi:hypothetical protein
MYVNGETEVTSYGMRLSWKLAWVTRRKRFCSEILNGEPTVNHATEFVRRTHAWDISDAVTVDLLREGCRRRAPIFQDHCVLLSPLGVCWSSFHYTKICLSFEHFNGHFSPQPSFTQRRYFVTNHPETATVETDHRSNSEKKLVFDSVRNGEQI